MLLQVSTYGHDSIQQTGFCPSLGYRPIDKVQGRSVPTPWLRRDKALLQIRLPPVARTSAFKYCDPRLMF